MTTMPTPLHMATPDDDVRPRRYTAADARALLARLALALPVAERVVTLAGLPRPLGVTPTPCWPCATAADRDSCPRHGGMA